MMCLQILLLLMLIYGATASEDTCASTIDHKANFLDLIATVTASLQEEHLGDHMVPICPQLTHKPTFEQEPQKWQKVRP